MYPNTEIRTLIAFVIRCIRDDKRLLQRISNGDRIRNITIGRRNIGHVIGNSNCLLHFLLARLLVACGMRRTERGKGQESTGAIDHADVRFREVSFELWNKCQPSFQIKTKSLGRHVRWLNLCQRPPGLLTTAFSDWKVGGLKFAVKDESHYWHGRSLFRVKYKSGGDVMNF